MSEAIKPTPGPWVTKQNGFCECAVIAGDVWITYSSGNERTPIQERSANASLIAEAGTVHHETGLTPRQLVEQRDALAEALKSVIENCEQHGDFRNGVTDPTGTIDEGMVAAAEFFGKARAALALSLAKGATP